MKIFCPSCPPSSLNKSERRTIIRHGSYWRKSDGRRVARFRCLRCRQGFSAATSHPCYRQKKRHRNREVFRLLAAAVSLREAARVTRLNRKTVVRKFLFLAARAKHKMESLQKDFPPAIEVQFDDLETFEITKCKPLSVSLMVETPSRRILGFEVSQMPASGHLAQISVKKYGPRADLRPQGRARLFSRMQGLVHPRAHIRTDSNPHYGSVVKKYFPEATHETVLGRKSAVTGQGELKKVAFDPIFSLNHTCAMLRAHLSRLIRKTWNTTKKRRCLVAHLWIYALVHNQRLGLKTTI